MQHSIGGVHHRIGVYDGKIAGLYDLEETLGSGHFAVVKLARHVFTGEKVAVKVIDKSKLDDVSRAHLYQEVRCMKLVQHPNVVRLYEVIDTQTKLYLILELGDGGDLYDYIMKHEGGLTENLAKEYFRQIVRAISYCHHLHVVHRDLKPENVVFFEKLGVVKLTDFGFSNKFCPGQKLETSCGSLAYSAPEILLGDSYDAPAVDVWSLGVILYMLVCGHPPFQEANDSETLTMIMDCKYTIPAYISAECNDLITAMLVVAPDKRSTLKEIAQHPWLMHQNDQDLLPEYLPLVSRQQVSEDDHKIILQKMINGNIAAKEEIIEALDKNEYNHITATYFLLVERKLRANRQEQAQKQIADGIVPPASNVSRITPKSRLQFEREELQLIKDNSCNSNNNNSEVLVPSNNMEHLSIPRVPGVGDGSQTNRIRKCSIVQEEDDEEDCESDENVTTLNRRGSRSEGKLNIAVQDRIAESERIKKEAASAVPVIAAPVAKPKGLSDGIYGVTLIGGCGPNDLKEKLGLFRGNSNNRLLKDYRPRMDVNPKVNFKSNSIDEEYDQNPVDPMAETQFLTDSSTITLPVTNQSYVAELTNLPKYKTMPSPTKSGSVDATPEHQQQMCLNEIFEEGTDVGSSDNSAKTTPRSVSRQPHYLSNRTQSQTQCTAQRRSKYNKTRTASCSSSDASDDDSENRKKRAHKIVDSSKPFQTQRRDSQDDSSDSQDAGNAAASGSSSSYPIQVIVGTEMTDEQTQGDSNQSNNDSNGRQKAAGSGQTVVGFRRHRTGRRRTGETRLRESQSLNRITEVQESESVSHQMSGGGGAGTHSHIVHQTIATEEITSSTTSSTVSTITTTIHHKSKGLNRFFHGFRKNDLNTGHHQHQHTTTITRILTSSENCSQKAQTSVLPAAILTQPPKPLAANEEVEMVLGAELAKALKVTETKTSTASKKLKILGRYFQTHKKLCIPLPGIFQRGRLYKAQSCSSIVRDKINQKNLTTSAAATAAPPPSSRHSALFSEKSRIFRNCLSGSKFLSNDFVPTNDYNQNNNKSDADLTDIDLSASDCLIRPLASNLSSSSSSSDIISSTIPQQKPKGTSCTIPNTSSPLNHHHNQHRHHQTHHLIDSSLCSSKC